MRAMTPTYPEVAMNTLRRHRNPIAELLGKLARRDRRIAALEAERDVLLDMVRRLQAKEQA